MIGTYAYKRYIRPKLFKMSEDDAEIGHEYVMKKLEWLSRHPFLLRFLKLITFVRSEKLQQNLWGLNFPNPIGLAAGMDKYAQALSAWEALGFGFIDFGGITKDEETGNPRPRQFRLAKHKAIINRMRFNNHGADKTRDVLRILPQPKIPRFCNVGKSVNTLVDDIDKVIEDYTYTVRKLTPYVSGFEINPSSPNSPGLRKLLGKKMLESLCGAVVQTVRDECKRLYIPEKPCGVKGSPDASKEEWAEMIEASIHSGIQFLTLVNTTVDKKIPGSVEVYDIQGGMSGRPLFLKALNAVEFASKEVCDKLVIIGCGGIFTINDALSMFRAGARLLKILTCLVYEGPFTPKNINKGILNHLKDCGYEDMSKFL